jgi:hypothetical protein
MATTAKALRILDACGPDVIELDVPDFDPLAECPVIQLRLFAYTICSYIVLSMYALASCILVYTVLGFLDTRSGEVHHI